LSSKTFILVTCSLITDVISRRCQITFGRSSGPTSVKLPVLCFGIAKLKVILVGETNRYALADAATSASDKRSLAC